MKSFVPNKRQQGFSLVELLLVLGVIALIAIAAFIIYPQVQAGTQANTEDTNVTTIAANAKSLFGNAGSYTGLNAGADVTGGQEKAIFPSGLLQGPDGSGAGAVTNQWGGTVTAVANATSATKFDITYNKVTDAACVKFVAGIAASFDTVTVDGNSVKAAGSPPNAANIAQYCGATSGDNHAVVFSGK